MVLLLHIISKLDRFTFRIASIRRKAFLGTRSPAGSRFDPIGMRAYSPIPISFKADPADRTAISGRFPSFLHFFPEVTSNILKFITLFQRRQRG
jgi:hypothetical protein